MNLDSEIYEFLDEKLSEIADVNAQIYFTYDEVAELISEFCSELFYRNK